MKVNETYLLKYSKVITYKFMNNGRIHIDMYIYFLVINSFQERKINFMRLEVPNQKKSVKNIKLGVISFICFQL